MPLPSRKEIRTQLFILVGFATAALSTTTFFLETQSPLMAPKKLMTGIESVDRMPVANLEEANVNWDDVNLATGQVVSPESEIKTARGKMLRDFEAR